MEESRSRGPRHWIRAALAILAAMLISGAYGVLVGTRHFFPYELIKRAPSTVHHAVASLRGQSARPGRRHVARVGAPASTEAIRQLANLPYLQGYHPATGGAGVRLNDRARSEQGLNFFTSSHAPIATLMDMDGAVVKSWKVDAARAFPGFVPSKRHRGHEQFLRDAELMPDGGILGMFDEIGLVRLDAASRVLWTWRGEVHHDFFVGEKGEIWTIFRERRVIAEIRPEEPIMEDFVGELSPEGKLVRRLSLVECFLRSPYAPLLANVPRAVGADVFHTNSVAVLDGTLAKRAPAFRRGNLLVSIKSLNLIAVVDPDAGRVVWVLSGQWYGQHCAHLLSTGRLLLFDNLGTMRLASRILEVDPFTQETVWSYGTGPGEDLLSETSGYVTRLANGNTLITESNFGRVLEVTPDHHTVWEFVNPNRAGKKNDLVAAVYFMERVRRDLPFLGNPGASSSSASSAAGSR